MIKAFKFIKNVFRTSRDKMSITSLNREGSLAPQSAVRLEEITFRNISVCVGARLCPLGNRNHCGQLPVFSQMTFGVVAKTGSLLRRKA